ncbi:MAG: hypothetical protein VKJ44_05855 [Synechococcus sp.]|nr:hypothetical protein [Synechococcus sp.]
MASSPSVPRSDGSEASDPRHSSAAIAPEQALAALALGLIQRQSAAEELSWSWEGAAEGEAAELRGLHRRLEVIQLALQTGAPLTTAEVTRLLGARPGAEQVERGGLIARRLSRNVWKLLRSGETGERPAAMVPFAEGFRRRL